MKTSISFSKWVSPWFFLLTLGFSSALLGQDPDPIDAIDPMIGTITVRYPGDFYGLGKTYPGAAAPLGIVQISPDTITGGDNASGYNYLQDSIEGFSLCHLSGTGWYGEMGNFQVMPTVGPLEVDRDKNRSPFSHDREEASVGYYFVHLDRYQIRTELTASLHSGMFRFTFPESTQSRIQVDLARRIGMKDRWLKHSRQYCEFLDAQTIQGWMDCPNTDGGWGQGAGGVSYRLYFYARLSKPADRFGVWDKSEVARDVDEFEGTNTGFFGEFQTSAGEQFLMKIGISYVDLQGAKANLEAEIPAWDFEEVHDSCRDQWRKVLDLVRFEGGTAKDRTVMATALYHCFLDPRSIVDVDGRYRAANGEVRHSQAFQFRTIFSGWDAFRSHFPLLTIIRPDVINDEINSWIELAEDTGNDYLPRWEMLHSYSGCMLGNPAVSVVLDAYQKGIRNYDVPRAYQLCVNSVEKFGNHPRGFTPNSLSHTVEYAYTDWCAGRFAELMGETADSDKFYQRSVDYKNLWDPEVQWLRAKDEQGNWTAWTKKSDYGQGCIESNPFQQAWFVPHDVQGLVDLMGAEFFAAELEAFFDKAPDDLQWNNYYNHPNEPCHHVAFLFNYIRKPWLTQKWTRKVCDVAYGTGPYGLCGNEDVGQLSAWYVLAAIGLHPVCPGDGLYQLTSPVFDGITIQLDSAYYSGKTFRVIAHNNSPDNLYIQSAKLNGKPLRRSWLQHHEVVEGGVLEFEMGPSPNHKWGTPRRGTNLPERHR